MKTKNLFHLLILLLLVTACEVKMAPSETWSTWFRTQSDSKYYKAKAEKLVEQLSRDTFEYEINRVAVIDPVNAERRAPILGEYISTRVVEAIAKDRVLQRWPSAKINLLTQLSICIPFSE